MKDWRDIPERLVALFKSKIGSPDANGCWPWLGRRNWARYGYGMWTCTFGGRSFTWNAHRLSYLLVHSHIPDGLQLDHLCQNKACVNPAHLEPVTPRVNVLRAHNSPATQNAMKTHCPRGHAFAEHAVMYPSGGRRCGVCDSLRAVGKKKAVIGEDGVFLGWMYPEGSGPIRGCARCGLERPIAGMEMCNRCYQAVKAVAVKNGTWVPIRPRRASVSSNA